MRVTHKLVRSVFTHLRLSRVIRRYFMGPKWSGEKKLPINSQNGCLVGCVVLRLPRDVLLCWFVNDQTNLRPNFYCSGWKGVGWPKKWPDPPTSSSRETILVLRCFDILPVKGGRQKLLNETTPLIKVPIKVWRDVGEPEEKEEESTFRLLQSSKWQTSSSFLPSCSNFASYRITCYINKNSSGGGLHQVVIRLSTVLTR